MAESTWALPGLSPVAGKTVHAVFDGGRLTSDADVLLLAVIDRRLGVCERLARCIEDPRAPERIQHTLAEMIRFRAPLIAAGFGLGGNTVLLGRVTDLAEEAAMGRLAGEADKVRRFGEFRYAARTWKIERRFIAQIEASAQGTDTRFIVTNLTGTPKAL